jgi:hypothetical protein
MIATGTICRLFPANNALQARACWSRSSPRSNSSRNAASPTGLSAIRRSSPGETHGEGRGPDLTSKTALRWVSLARRDWTAYIAEREQDL